LSSTCTRRLTITSRLSTSLAIITSILQDSLLIMESNHTSSRNSSVETAGGVNTIGLPRTRPHAFVITPCQHSSTPLSRPVCRLNDEKLNGKFDTIDKSKLESATALNDGHMTVAGYQRQGSLVEPGDHRVHGQRGRGLSMYMGLPDFALTLHFASYSSQQLLQVLQARLSPLYDTSECPEVAGHANMFLPTATLTLLTKTIASQTGDVRALFEVLRGAIDLAVTGSKAPVADANSLATPPPIVRPDHILVALKAYLPSTSTAHSSSASTLSPTSPRSVTSVCKSGWLSYVPFPHPSEQQPCLSLGLPARRLLSLL
jgi:hypothetical protein